MALFAGAGGGILGSHLMGWNTVCAVERDAYAASIWSIGKYLTNAAASGLPFNARAATILPETRNAAAIRGTAEGACEGRR